MRMQSPLAIQKIPTIQNKRRQTQEYNKGFWKVSRNNNFGLVFVDTNEMIHTFKSRVK